MAVLSIMSLNRASRRCARFVSSTGSATVDVVSPSNTVASASSPPVRTAIFSVVAGVGGCGGQS